MAKVENFKSNVVYLISQLKKLDKIAMATKTKESEYTVKILAQLQELFNPDCENHIDLQDFKDDRLFKDFLYALSCVAPNIVCENLSGLEKTNLEFNHMVNHLCFEYSEKVK